MDDGEDSWRGADVDQIELIYIHHLRMARAHNDKHALHIEYQCFMGAVEVRSRSGMETS